MIETIKEPPLEGIEHCIFCDTPTRYWDLTGHHPVCEQCSKTKTQNDVDNLLHHHDDLQNY